LPLPDDSLDRILAQGCLDRVPDRPAFLAEARRLLSPGGLLCLAGPESEVQQMEILEALRQAGFAVVVGHSEVSGGWCLTAEKGRMES
jgi:ubiquinone/menaquinone biosynthesis C-methylase UbiE